MGKEIGPNTPKDVGAYKYAVDFMGQKYWIGDSAIFPVQAGGKVGLDDGVVVEVTGINRIVIAQFGGAQFTFNSKMTVKGGKE